MSEIKKDGLSRRKFLVSAGAMVAGAVAASGVIGAINPKPAEAFDAPPALGAWPYTPIDPDRVRVRAYNAYKVKGCCYGAAYGLVTALKEELALIGQTDTVWNTLPLDVYEYGKGGVLSWGTLCGALNGAIPILSLITGSALGKFANPLMYWYQNYPFPSDALMIYKQGTMPYGPLSGTQYDQSAWQTVANSPLCHTSVSQWCTASGKRVNGPEKSDRCGKLTADTAAKCVEWLNAWYTSGKTVFPPQIGSPGYEWPEEQVECMTCHTGPTSTYDSEQGTMNCIECHDDAYYRSGHHGF